MASLLIKVIQNEVEAATQWTKSARPGFQSHGETDSSDVQNDVPHRSG
jgi:hypothetical protein